MDIYTKENLAVRQPDITEFLQAGINDPKRHAQLAE